MCVFVYGCAVQHVGSYFPDQGLNPCPLLGSTGPQPLDHQGSPSPNFWKFHSLFLCPASDCYLVSHTRHCFVLLCPYVPPFGSSLLLPDLWLYSVHLALPSGPFCVCYTDISAAKSLSRVWLCDPIDGSPPGSPIPGILQARTLEWVLPVISDWLWNAKNKETTGMSFSSVPFICWL